MNMIVRHCSTQEGYDFDDAECKAAVKILDTNSDG